MNIWEGESKSYGCRKLRNCHGQKVDRWRSNTDSNFKFLALDFLNNFLSALPQQFSEDISCNSPIFERIHFVPKTSSVSVVIWGPYFLNKGTVRQHPGGRTYRQDANMQCLILSVVVKHRFCSEVNGQWWVHPIYVPFPVFWVNFTPAFMHETRWLYPHLPYNNKRRATVTKRFPCSHGLRRPTEFHVRIQWKIVDPPLRCFWKPVPPIWLFCRPIWHVGAGGPTILASDIPSRSLSSQC